MENTVEESLNDLVRNMPHIRPLPSKWTPPEETSFVRRPPGLITFEQAMSWLPTPYAHDLCLRGKSSSGGGHGLVAAVQRVGLTA